MRRGAAWTAECQRGAAWLRPWPESRWQSLPPAVLVADRRRRRLRRRILGRWFEIGQRRRARRECQDACHAVRRRPVSTVWRPLSCPAAPGPAVRCPAVRCPAVRCPAVRCPAVRVSKPSGVQPSGCPAIWCPPRPPSPRAARRSAQSDLEQVTPAEAWVGRRASIGRDLAGCRWVAAVAALDRLIDEAARPLRGSPVGRDRASVGSVLSTMLPHLPRGCAPMPSGAERA